MAPEMKPAPLADGEMGDAVMAAQHIALGIDNRARARRIGAQPVHDGGIAPVGHETDILAVGLVGRHKTEFGGQVMDTFNRLGAKVPVVALVESAIGIENATEIARAKGVFRLAFGSGDFRRDTGMSADREAMAYPRARLVISSRAGGLPGPIDGPTVGSSHPILREQSAITVSMGMTGKLCLTADQTPVVNEVISPTPSDLGWARQFLSDFEARGRIVRDGSDLPRLRRAEKICSLAEAFHITAPT